MTHKSQLEDPLYKNWVKGGLASKYLKEGIEHMIDNALINIQRKFLSDISDHLTLREAKCTDCTTANCLPCPTIGICNITGKGRDRKCSYHIKGDALKEHRKCPEDICDSLYMKITSQHRYGRPAWQNTDATKWCTDHCEIAKCFLPGSGYADKISLEDTDCSGLLNLAINCLDVQTHLDLYLEPPNGIFSQILNFRNKIFHSASLSLTTHELKEYIDLMIKVLQDKKELKQDTLAQTAVLNLEQLKDEGFFISTRDEDEIRQESIVKFQQEIKDDYLGRKRELQGSLCRMYEEHFKTIPISPLLDDIEAEIDDVFVDLVLCDDSIYSKDSKENSRQNGRKIENYKNIFYNDKDKCKNIYVIGDAGMGKSTWCMKMLRNWVSAQHIITNGYTNEPDRMSKSEESTHLGINDGQQKPEKNADEKLQKKGKLEKSRPTLETLIQNNLNQEQITKEDCINLNENVMTEFDIVLFVALRHAPEDGNIRDMIRNQLFQERTYLDDLTTEVLKKEPEKCLIIVDGLDEWTRPANSKCISLLQHPSLPGRKGLNGCPILTTTRPWKLNDIRLQSNDCDRTIKIQGIEDVRLLTEKLINCKIKMSDQEVPNRKSCLEMFEKEVEKTFTWDYYFMSWNYALPFLKVPLILIFFVCSWFDNGHLENTMAGNFTGFMKCLFSVAEKDKYSRKKGRLNDMEEIASLKREWSMCFKYLPKSLQEIELFSAYSQLLIKLGKFAFDSLFNSNYVCLVFSESAIRSKLTIKEVEVAVKVGILSQSKVVGKTLTQMSSLSFLHKTIQEYLAAVYLCSSAEGHKEAIETFAYFCLIDNCSVDNVRTFVKDINLSTLSELYKHCAKYDAFSENQFLQSMNEEWTLEIKDKITSKSNSCCLYGAVLSGTDLQTLEIKTNGFLELWERIPNESKKDDDIIDIKNIMTWCSQSPYLYTDRLRTVQLVRVHKMSTNETELCKIDLSHCNHLKEVSFQQMNYVQIILNYENLTDIILKHINSSDIHVIKTTSNGSIVKQVKMINMQHLETCKLSLPIIFLEIEVLTVIECENLVIKIDKVTDTYVTKGHFIKTVCYEMHNETGNVKMEPGNDLKIDTLILHTNQFGQNSYLRNPFVPYISCSLIVEHQLNCILTLKSLCQISENNSLTCLKLKYNSPNYTEFAGCIRNMKQLKTLRINIISTRNETLEIMRSLQSLPCLENLGLIMYNRSENIVAEYLPGMTKLKRLELWLENDCCNPTAIPPEVQHSLSTSISKLSNIVRIELKWLDFYTSSYNYYCSIGEILLHSLPHLSNLKHLHCDLYFTECVETLSNNLPKMVDLESLYEGCPKTA